MRHKDVKKCAVGGFAFYLFFRFHVSREMDEQFRPDFTDNRSWFDIKILTDGTRKNTKVMAKKSYTDEIRKIFKDLKIVASHFGHWGRVSAPVELEFNELSPDLIRILGELLCVFALLIVAFEKSSNSFSSQVTGILKHRIPGIRASCL